MSVVPTLILVILPLYNQPPPATPPAPPLPAPAPSGSDPSAGRVFLSVLLALGAAAAVALVVVWRSARRSRRTEEEKKEADVEAAKHARAVELRVVVVKAISASSVRAGEMENWK
ncbi:hypothetical protein ACP4OV_010130 [Aristida adscensionis]